MGVIARFFGFGIDNPDASIIAELSEDLELERAHNKNLRGLFEEIRSNALPTGDDGWGFHSGVRGDEQEVIAGAVFRMFESWRDNLDAVERLLTVEDERDALVEQNDRLMQEIGRLQAEAVLPVEVSKDHVPQLALEARKPRVFSSVNQLPDRLVVRDDEGDRFKIDGGVVLFALGDEPNDWSYWYSDDGEVGSPDKYAPFTEVLPRTFQRGDVIPDDVTQVLLASANYAVERAVDGKFVWNTDVFDEGWGPSDTSDAVWNDEDFPLTEVLN